MDREIRTAAKWWANHLRGPVEMDNGDALQSSFASMFSSRNKPLTKEQIATFEIELAKEIKLYIEDSFNEAVAEGNPRWGSGIRVIAVDYHPMKLMKEAACRAGFDLGMTRLPIKTCMWINPGEVSVACGYGSDQVTLDLLN
jgi:hypothetical protein